MDEGVESIGRAALVASPPQRRGLERAYLQVEEQNTGAQALYSRAGFKPAWVYEYLRRPA